MTEAKNSNHPTEATLLRLSRLFRVTKVQTQNHPDRSFSTGNVTLAIQYTDWKGKPLGESHLIFDLEELRRLLDDLPTT